MTRSGIFQRLREHISGARTVDLPVSCYGKLPIYKDFLRENLASKPAQAFKQWLDKGISHYWGPSDAYRKQTILPHAFLLRFPGTGSYVVGYLWGSTDEGALRFFPFSMFTSLPAGREAFPPHAVLDALEPVIAAGRRWHHEASQLGSFEDFVTWSRGLILQLTVQPEHEATEELLRRSEALTLCEFIAGLWERGDGTEWPALLSYLNRHQTRVREHRHPVDLAVRLPSSNRMPLVFQAQCWTLILEQFDTRRERPFQMLIPTYDDKAGITLMLRNLRPDDVYAFHPEMPLNEHIEDFRERIPHRPSSEHRPLGSEDRERPLRAVLDLRYRPPAQPAAPEA
jgi:type VI secretion system ImpM family protein